MTAKDLFNAIFDASLALMLITLVASLGLGMTVRQIVEPMKRVVVLVVAVLVNIVIAPLIAIGVCDLFSLSTEARIGVVLTAVAAGGPTGIKCAQLAKRSDMAMALSFTVVLILLNIVAAPLWAGEVVSGATVDRGQIVINLLLLILLPLVVGLVLRSRYAEHATGWKDALEKISNIALLVAIVVGIAVNWSLLTSQLGTRVLIASVIITLLFIAAGWVGGLVGGRQSALTNGMVASTRFQVVGLIVIATSLHNNGAYLSPALIFCLLNTVVPVIVGLELGRLASHHAKSATAPDAPQAPPSPAVISS